MIKIILKTIKERDIKLYFSKIEMIFSTFEFANQEKENLI
jgi:hypothetical protein